jgi:hypothetical protein
MTMALQIGGTTVVNNNRGVENITQITFNDGAVQKTKPLKLVGEVINSSTQSNSFFGLSAFNQITIVWESAQFSGPAGAALTIYEQTSGTILTTQTTSSFIQSSSTVNTVTQTSQASGNTNVLGSIFQGTNVVTRGRVVLTKVRQTTATQSQRWNVDILGGNSSQSVVGSSTIGTSNTSVLGWNIDWFNLTLNSCNSINIRVYGQE